MLFLFDEFGLDTDRRELRGPTGLISVEPQVFDLLAYLIRHRDRVVSKDDIMAAVWGGRIVSESTLTTRINAARSAVGDSGEAQRLIRTLPRKGLRFVGSVREAKDNAAAELQSTLPLPDRPSIAVLPFVNMSGDPEQEYFADGIVEEIIIALSRMRWLFVIARNSSFTYKGRAVDVKQIGRELGVRYVLEGSVRKAGRRVRIAGQLIDSLTGIQLWADRFDGGLKDIFDLQDQVTASVVGAIGPKLEQAEIERARRKPTESLDAYDYFLRGKASFYQLTREAQSEALRLFYKAIEIDPNFASAYGIAAWCYAHRRSSGWTVDPIHETAETGRLARRAVEIGRDDAIALSSGGFALAYVVGDLDDGTAFIDRALGLNPNLAAAWYLSGRLKVFYGEPEVAVEHLANAMRLSPLDPLMFGMLHTTAHAHFRKGRYLQALSWAEKALRERPNYLPSLRLVAASNALAGRMEEAKKAVRLLHQIDSALRLSTLKDYLPRVPSQDLAKWTEGLRKAGLPE